MKFLSQRLLFIILSLVFLLAAFFVYSNFVKPEYTAVTDLRAELAAKTDTLGRYDVSFSKLQSMLGNQNIGQLKESVSRILPNSSDDGYLMAQIVGFAKLNGLQILSISNSMDPIVSSKSKVIQSVGVLKTKIQLRGAYSGVRSYVQQLENNLLLIDVLGFEAAAEDGSGQVPGFEYTLSLASYYQVK